MGAIGTMIQAAEYASARPGNIDRFEGSFPPHQATYSFETYVTPSKLSRLGLVASILAATIHASDNGGWRELELNTTSDGDVIARGGDRKSLQLWGLGPGDGANVTNS